MIIAGDLFHHARPSNVTLENSIRSFKRLRDAGIPVLTVDGSHDAAPNLITGTILHPLDSAGLIYHLPRHEGACWIKPSSCYVYGVPNFRTRRKTEEMLPVFMEQNPPKLEPDVSNIFVFHAAVDLPSVNPPYIEAEIPPELLPNGFNYYAGGHLHKRYAGEFKTGILAYSGGTETVSYDEAAYEKGFFHVKVNEKGKLSQTIVKVASPRKFAILEHDFSGMSAAKITEMAIHLVKNADDEGIVVIPILKGVLPAEANRSEVDIARIRGAAEKAVLVHPIVLLKEKEVSDEIVRSIFESEFKDLKTKAYEYFLQIFNERYNQKEAEKIAHLAVALIEPLTKKQEKKVKDAIQELLR